MAKSQPDAFIFEKGVEFQVEFPSNEIQFPGSHTPLDRIFYTYEQKPCRLVDGSLAML